MLLFYRISNAFQEVISNKSDTHRIVVMEKTKRRELSQQEKADANRLVEAWKAYKDKHPGATQEWLGRDTGLGSQGLIGQYLRGIIPLNLPALLAFSKTLGVEPGSISPVLAALLELSKYPDSNSAKEHKFDKNVVPAEIGRRRIPVISYVQAGRMTEMRTPFSAGDVFEYLMTDLALSDRAFALEIRGKSMEPEFREGDHAIFDPEVAPRPGDFVVAKNGSEEATFKKYRPRGVSSTGQEIFELAPLNDDYPTLRSDSQQITIIAVLVEYRRYLRR